MVFVRINSNRIYLHLLLTWREKKIFLYLGQINSEDYFNIRFKSILDQLFFFNLNWAPLWIPFYCSVTQSHLTLRPHELKHARLPCLSLSPGVWSNSCPLNLRCHTTSVSPFSSCLQSLPASGFFPNELALHIRWPKYWSFNFNIGPSNEYSGLISFRIDWSPYSPRDSQESSPTPQSETNNSSVLEYWSGLTCPPPGDYPSQG